jgi:CheY-like chemotaxis protein
MGNTILLADKSITIQKIVELTFSDDEYEIKCVNDGQAALEAIPQVRPSIILADISLPVKSGYELCEALRKDPSFAEFSRTPVILLAGIYETMDEERAKAVEERVREVGANDLLSKPFDPQLLTTKVKELMASSAPAFVDDSLSRTQNIDMGSEITQTGLIDQVEGDAEKTMMLPGFSTNVFAEAPGFEGVDVDPHQATVKIDSVSPGNEPIFEEAHLQTFAEAPEVPAQQERPTFDFNDGSFIPQQEPEFSFEGTEETVISRDALYATAPQPKETVFEPAVFEPPQEDQTTVPHPTAIIPDADEPFGDVFETSESAASWNTASTDEDSPFGLPEVPAPPPPPVVDEPVEAMPPAKDAETTGPLRVPPEMTWAQESEASAEEMIEDVEEPAAQSEMTPVFGEEIWSRERSLAGERTAEELFESESSQDTVPAVEEAVELQPDLAESENIQDESNITAKQPAVSAPAVTAPPEITEELINKIADRVVGKLSEKVISDIVWQVVPDLAEKMIRRELEKLHAGEE